MKRNCETCVWYESLDWAPGYLESCSTLGACHMRPDVVMKEKWDGCRFHEEGPPEVVSTGYVAPTHYWRLRDPQKPLQCDRCELFYGDLAAEGGCPVPRERRSE